MARQQTHPIMNQPTAIPALVGVSQAVHEWAGPVEEQTLKKEENGGADDGDEVEGEVDEISDQGRRGEALKGALENLAEPLHGLGARFDLAALANDVGGVSGDKGAIKGVEDGILNDEIAGDDLTMVELSLMTKRTVETTARGPLTKTRTAS